MFDPMVDRHAAGERGDEKGKYGPGAQGHVACYAPWMRGLRRGVGLQEASSLVLKLIGLRGARSLGQLTQCGDAYPVLLAPPRAAVKPQRMTLMTRTSRPDRVDEEVVNVSPWRCRAHLHREMIAADGWIKGCEPLRRGPTRRFARATTRGRR